MEDGEITKDDPVDGLTNSNANSNVNSNVNSNANSNVNSNVNSNANYQFQLASDIHIEKKYPNLAKITDFIIPSSKNLILAGDIGSIYMTEQLAYFLSSCKDAFETVIFVPGNNEYYTREGFEPMSFNELNAILNSMCEKLNVILLNNSYVETSDLIIFGSIWWSFVPDVLNMRIIMENGEPITADEFNYMHAVSRLSLNKVLKIKGTKRLLVITHYCPTKMGTMNLHHKSEEFKALVPYYFSSSEKYLRCGKIDTWIFGHTHVFRDFLFDKVEAGVNTRIISNADPRKRFFRPNYVFEI